MKRIARIPLRVVFYRDEDDKTTTVAHCLEFDLIGHGRDRRSALKMLTEAIATQVEYSVEHGDPRSLFSPAPAEFVLKFAKGRDVARGELAIEQIHKGDFEFDEVCAREHDEADEFEYA